jgi:RNA polymerase primary sigma factor
MRQRKASEVHESADFNLLDLSPTNLEDAESLEIPEEDLFPDEIPPDDDDSDDLSPDSNQNILELYFSDCAKKTRLSETDVLNLAKQKDEGKTEKIRHEAENKLIEGFLFLVINLALKYKNSKVPLLELIQEGNIALITAARYYDYKRGLRFSTLATICISRQIAASYYQRTSQLYASKNFKEKVRMYTEFTSMHLKENGTLPDEQTVINALGLRDSEEYGTAEYQLHIIAAFPQTSVVSLEQPISAQNDLTPAEVIPSPEHNPRTEVVPALLTAKLKTLISSLEPAEIQLLKLRHEQGLTLKEIAAKQRPLVSKQAIDQRLRIIYQKLQTLGSLSREVLALYLESQEFD